MAPRTERLRPERAAVAFEKLAAEGEPEAEATEDVDPSDDDEL
ncbi:hypothetical protein WME79_17345 [Sorangium sp. So ce726]